MPLTNRESADEPVDDIAYRWIGGFCGAVLGICVAALFAYAVGIDSIPIVATLVVLGLVLGGTIGYRLPYLSDAMLWVASLFT
jgi:hypothetical protein